MKLIEQLSQCCNATIQLAHPEREEGETNYYICSWCQHATDPKPTTNKPEVVSKSVNTNSLLKRLRERLEGEKDDYFGKCTDQVCVCETESLFNVCENSHNQALDKAIQILEEEMEKPNV